MSDNIFQLTEFEEVDPITGLTNKGKKSNKPKYDLGSPVTSIAQEALDIPEEGLMIEDLYKDIDTSVYDEGITYSEAMQPQGLQKYRHEEQPWFASLGAAGLQTATTLVGQTMEGIGYLLDGEQWVNMAKGVEKEYNNWFSQLGKDLQEAGREIAPIYTDPDKEGGVNLGDWTYWMSNAPSIASSLSFFIPATGVVKAASLLGKGLQAAGALGKVSNVAKGIGKGLIGGISSRAMEGAMEASALHQQFEQMAGQQLTMQEALKIEKEYGVPVIRETDDTGTTKFYLSPEAAKEAGAKAAARNFNANMALLLTDVPQFMLAMTPYGKVTEKLTGKVAKAMGKSAMPVIGKTAATYATQMMTEGLEEGYQYISSERSKDVELARMGLIDETDFSETLSRTMQEGEFATSMIFGALGAGVMQGASKGIDKIINRGKITMEDERIANAEGWNASMKVYAERLKAAEANNNPLDYDATVTEFTVDKLITDVNVGNLGYSIERINDIANATEEEQAAFGMTSDEINSIKQQLPKVIELAARVEEVYQANLNETGNRTMASIITKHDLLTTEYNKIQSEADNQVSKVINDRSSWVNPSSNNDVSTFAKAKAIINQAEVKKVRLLQERADSLKDGIPTFRTRQLDKSIELVDKLIEYNNKIIEDVKTRSTNISSDVKAANLTNEAKNTLKKAAINLVNASIERDYNANYSDFYRSPEGKEMFKKENYKVTKKKIKDKIKQADTVEEVNEAKETVKGTEYEGVVEEAEKEVARDGTPVVTPVVTPTPKVPVAPAPVVVPTEEEQFNPTEREDIRPEEAERFEQLSGETAPKTGEQLMNEWEHKERYNQPGTGMQLAVDIKKSIESLKKENNPIAEELERVLGGEGAVKNETFTAYRWGNFIKSLFDRIAAGNTSNDTAAYEAAANANKALDTINFHIRQGKGSIKPTKEVPPVVAAEQVTNPTINKSLRVNRTNNGNTVWVTFSDNSIALNNVNSHIDVKDFNIPIGSTLYIEKSQYQGSATPAQGNVFYEVVYYDKNNNRKVIGNINTKNTAGSNAGNVATIRTKLDMYFEQAEAAYNAKKASGKAITKQDEANRRRFPQPVVLSGYRGEYQYTRPNETKPTPTYIKPSEAPAKGKTSNTPLQKLIDSAGGFLVGVVRGKTVGDSRLIEFPGTEGMQGVPTLRANDSTSAELRRSMSTVKEVEGGKWAATYIKPHDTQRVKNNLNEGETYEQVVLRDYSEEIPFKTEQEANDYLQEEFDQELAGNVFIIVPNPIKPDEALHIRAFSMTVGEMAKYRPEVYKEVKTNLFSALVNTTGEAREIVKVFRDLVRITKGDAIKLNNFLVQSFKDNAERLAFLEGILNGKEMPAELAQIVNSADIITDAENFNNPQYDKPTIFGDKPGMPYNKLIEEALAVTTKAGEPLTNGTPLVDFSGMDKQPIQSIPVPQNNPEAIAKEGKAPVQGTIKENPPVVSTPAEVVKTNVPTSDIDAKKADIERRRQEELRFYTGNDLKQQITDLLNSKVPVPKITVKTNDSLWHKQRVAQLEALDNNATIPRKIIRAAFINTQFVVDGEKYIVEKDSRYAHSNVRKESNNEIIGIITDNGYDYEGETVHKDIFLELLRNVDSPKISEFMENKINAKYDAELSALTKEDKSATTSSETPPVNKAVIASIKNKIGGKTRPKLSQSTSTQVTPDSKEELDWFRTAFPNIPIKDLQEIAGMVREVTSQGATAWGAFYDAAIYMREAFPEGTVYHEAFHVLFNLALKEKEINTLLAQAEGKTIEEKEEWLADKFKEVIITGKVDNTDKSIKGYISKMLNKLGLFLRSMFNANVKSLEELAYRVNRGKYKNLHPTRFNQPTLRLYKTVPGWSYDKAVRAVDTINRFIVTDLLPDYKKNNKLDGATDADVLTHYVKTHGNNPLSIYREMSAIFTEILNDTDSGLTEEQHANLKDLVDKMFPTEGELNLVISAIEELGNNHNMVLTIKGTAHESVSLYDYYEEMSMDKETSEVYDVNFVTKSNKNDASSRVKTAIRYLETGYYNEFGLPEYLDYDETYNTLLKDLEGSISVIDIKNKLSLLMPIKPHYKDLYDRMDTEPAFATDMLQAFNRTKMQYFIMTKKKGKYYIFDSTRSGVVNSIKEQWANNFYKGNEIVNVNKTTGDATIDTTKAKELYTQYIDLAKRFVALPKESNEITDVANQISDILGKMTMDITPETLIYLKNNSDWLAYTLLNKENSISVILKAITDGINPYEVTEDSNLNPALNKVAMNVKDSMPELYELSHMTVEGEKAYSHIIPTFLTNFINNMKNIVIATQLVEQYKQDALFHKNGMIYNPLLSAIESALKQTDDALKQEALNNIFNIGVMEGYNIANQKVPYVEMQDYDLKMLSVNAYYNNGNTKKGMFRLPPLSDSGNMLIMEFDKLNQQQSMTYLLRLAEGEFNRISNLKEAKEGSSIYANYDNARNKSTETGYSIMPMMNGLNTAPSANKVEAQKRINEFFNEEANAYYKSLVDKGVIVLEENGNIDAVKSNIDASIILSKDARSETDRRNPEAMKLFIKEMLMNDFVARTSISLMTIGDPAFYSEKVKGDTVTVNRIVDYFKRAKEIFSPKSNPDVNAVFQPRDAKGNPVGKPVEVRTEYKSVYLKDEKITAPSYDAILSFLQTELDSGRINQQTFDSLSDAYKEVNHTDAQAFITADFYRETMIAHGLWDDRKQLAYDKLEAGQGTADDLIVMNPIKPYMYSQIFDADRKLMVPVQHKNSEYVIFKQFTDNNPRLKALYDYMKANNVSIANFDSAVKTGLKNATTLDDIAAGNLPMVQTIPMSERGIQMATPEHHIDADVKEGTQARAIVFSDMNPDSKYRLEGNGREMTSQQLRDEYLDMLEANLKESFNDVKDMFYENGKFNWKLVQDVLLQEAVDRRLPDDFKAAIKYIEANNTLALPVFDPVFNEKMESLFTSIMRNRITKQKMAGAALIQASSVGLREDLKLVFKDDADNLVESEKTITFGELESDVKQALETKGYTTEMWDTLTEEEKNHAIKCSKV